jgi:predicted small lipoprotein YifL
MKTVRILALVLMLALTVAACGSAGTMSPEELVQAYVEAQNKQDVETSSGTDRRGRGL